MSWKAYEFDTRNLIGEYPDEMSMAEAVRNAYQPGFRLIVENDDGRQFEAFRDVDTVKIVTSPSLAELENEDMYEDAGYSPSDGQQRG